MVAFRDALQTARNSRQRRKFPKDCDPRAFDGLLFPIFKPKFPMHFEGSLVFTIGSCFARNIEEALQPYGVDLPTMDFTVPEAEYQYRTNGLLNEYNPGTMNQRILFALNGKDYPTETIVPAGDLYVDLLLHGGEPVTFERAIARRKEIAAVYEKLSSADLVVITLGMIEVWFDKETGLYLNQMPPSHFAEAQPDRFEFKRLDVFDCMRLLEEACLALTQAGLKILLTVSPVPLQTTFSGRDCIVANEFSKSVLRVVAERLASRQKIDYFPSYEIVRSGGLGSFVTDHIHVKPRVVEQVTGYMLSAYLGARDNSGSGTVSESAVGHRFDVERTGQRDAAVDQ